MLLQIFAKAPVIGQVKTRIAKTHGKAFALQLHRRLCEHMIAMALQSNVGAVEVWTTDARALGYFEALGVDCCLQQGQNLGTRMDFALRHGLARHDRVVIVGADAASIDAGYVQAAFTALQQSTVVVGPASDGGYVLVGATQPVPFLFRDMPWGTPEVMGLTLERLLAGGCDFHVLAERWDIDTADDLRRHLPQWLPPGGGNH
ncbi:MAG: flagellar biosynthesis protein FlgB [Pseudomonadales bacterium]|nr:flagellar biosynthesis protein FlgB [Pseudomonadales bacterium]MEC8810532.1 TIGR04282 family arsenosugar biosynthesis glycosyltransferase [Pseudomonadota bacterium]HAG93140.1 hypothetical protein [Gammaproteobacteria bacterium]MAQ25005.1 flagellar biosynthesis protein FlgB [Pseudomonadales bacterium]MBI26855.1 flagellar biosynthesis protein FlgB [Pseudomonadales bacterium]|tara:strand:+ start:44652 stop:45260 length:609 start_codon:yes stop_codon:yes gene_type:complete